MKIILLIIFILPCSYLLGQKNSESNLTKKRTNQWVSFVSSSSRYSKCIIITKQADSCQKVEVRIDHERVQEFLDSLKGIGFHETQDPYVDISGSYKVTTELVSFSVDRITGQDSIYKFIYSVNLLNLKTNKSQSSIGTWYTKDKDKFLLAFKDKEFFYSDINAIKRTSIIRVMLNFIRIVEPAGVFAPVQSFYF